MYNNYNNNVITMIEKMEEQIPIKNTTVRISNMTKERLNNLGRKNETYDDVINRLLIDYHVSDKETLEITNLIDGPGKRACFYLGVLTAKTYENYTKVKLYDKIKKLGKNNFQDVYVHLVADNGLNNDSVIRMISTELAKSKCLEDVDDDTIKLYFTHGLVLSSKFHE